MLHMKKSEINKSKLLLCVSAESLFNSKNDATSSRRPNHGCNNVQNVDIACGCKGVWSSLFDNLVNSEDMLRN